MDRKNLLLMLLILSFATIGQLLLKKGSISLETLQFNSIEKKINLLIKVFTNPMIILGLVFYSIQAFMWIIILNKVELSKAAPLFSLNYVFALLAGAFIFHEEITIHKVLGVLIIMVGVYFITQN